jgi:glycosyltransferase involved in cell wall biosynthesis
VPRFGFAQTYKDFEAIVVNDGSPDTPELEKVLAPYLNRIVYLKQENKRAAGARNNAIRHARGEFVAFLDSDDTWMPDHLARRCSCLPTTRARSYVFQWPGWERGGARIHGALSLGGEATFGSLLVERCQIPISTVVARKRRL